MPTTRNKIEMNGFGKGRVDFFEDDFGKLITKNEKNEENYLSRAAAYLQFITQPQKSKQASLLN